MKVYSASKAAAMAGLEGFTLRGWCRDGYVEPTLTRTDKRWMFTPADVALLAVTKPLVDFGMPVRSAFDYAKRTLPDLKASDEVKEVIAQAKGKRMSVTPDGQVNLSDRFPKVETALLLIDIGNIVREAFSRQP